MTKSELKSAPTLLLACWALSGCAMFDGMGHPIPPSRPPVNCKAGDCTVTVRVDAGACDKTKIHVDRDPLVVDARYQGPIFWELATPGYSFTTDGIDILRNNGQFNGKAHLPMKFKWNNTHTDQLRYKYEINLLPSGSSAVCNKDPTIMN